MDQPQRSSRSSFWRNFRATPGGLLGKIIKVILQKIPKIIRTKIPGTILTRISRRVYQWNFLTKLQLIFQRNFQRNFEAISSVITKIIPRTISWEIPGKQCFSKVVQESWQSNSQGRIRRITGEVYKGFPKIISINIFRGILRGIHWGVPRGISGGILRMNYSRISWRNFQGYSRKYYTKNFQKFTIEFSMEF